VRRATAGGRAVQAVLLLLLALLPVLPAAAAGPVLVDVAVRDSGTTLTVELVMSAPAAAEFERLDYPPRLSITLPDAALSPDAPRSVEIHRGDVLRVRVLQIDRPRTVRAVVDLAAWTAYEISNPLPNVVAVTFAVPPVPAAEGRAPAPARAVTLAFRDTPLSDILRAIAKVCGFSVFSASPLDRKVTAELDAVPCEVAVSIILQAADLTFRRTGTVLVVLPAEKAAPQAFAAGYRLSSADPETVAKQLTALVKGITVQVDGATNTLYVIGTEDQHAQVRRLLPSLDVAAVHVQIEAAVVDVSMNVLRELGLSWGISTPQEGGATILQAPGVKVVTGLNAVARIQALVTQGKARVLASPRIVTPSGQKATISLGEDFPIPSRDAEGNVTFTFRKIGVTLDILPRANRDGTVTSEVTVKVESVLELLPTPAGPVPRVASREIKLVVRTRSGESIVLGGLISREERTGTVKVPFLGDLPVLGRLFQATTRSERESEVVFTLTPRIAGQEPAP